MLEDRVIAFYWTNLVASAPVTVIHYGSVRYKGPVPPQGLGGRTAPVGEGGSIVSVGEGGSIVSVGER